MADSASIRCTFSDLFNPKWEIKISNSVTSRGRWHSASLKKPLAHRWPPIAATASRWWRAAICEKIALCSFSQNVVGTFLCRFRFPFRILEGIVNPRKPQRGCVCVCVFLFVPDLKIMSSVRIVWFSTSWISRKHTTQKTFPHSLPRPVRKTCLVRHLLVL